MDHPIDDMLWDLTFLYDSSEAEELKRDFSSADKTIEDFRTSYRGCIASLTAAQLKEALRGYEALHNLLVRPQTYAYLLFAADSEDPVNKKLSQRSMEFANKASQELLFFDLEIIDIPDNRFNELIRDSLLAPYGHYLEALRRYKPHTLPEREERLLKQKSLTGIEAFTRLFDELASSFRYRFELDGEEREMTGEELLGLLHHAQAEVRERAFGTFLKKFEENAITFSTIINNVALDYSQELQLRGYRSVMEPTHLANEVAPEAVDRLMKVSEDNYHLAQEYFRFKARLLKAAKLKNTDIYAPIQESDRRFDFEEAKELVLDAYGSFSGRFRTIVEKFFIDRRIDALPRPGKSGGAFCMGISPSLPPCVLMNYTGNLRDVSTLAHELGHGLHFVLAQEQSTLNYHPPLPLAETASVFGEMLLTRLLLEREHDPGVKISLLCAKIEDIIATTFRQNVLTRFEERVHLERKNGLLSAQDIGDIWWEENARLYGDSVEMIEPYRWGWSYISHFIHSRFYCYSYTFAELLVLSLFRKYQAEGLSFVPTYTDILKSGGSRSPADTVRPAGIDFTDPGFWQEGYDCLEDLLNELRKLV
jgi:oligoendopeptidase F